MGAFLCQFMHSFVYFLAVFCASYFEYALYLAMVLAVVIFPSFNIKSTYQTTDPLCTIYYRLQPIIVCVMLENKHLDGRFKVVKGSR